MCPPTDTSAAALTGDCARLGADVVSYSFILTCTDYSLPVSRRTAKNSGHYREMVSGRCGQLRQRARIQRSEAAYYRPGRSPACSPQAHAQSVRRERNQKRKSDCVKPASCTFCSNMLVSADTDVWMRTSLPTCSM